MKAQGKIWILFLLTFIIINAIIVLVPFEKTGNLIVAWAGTVLMFLIGGVVLKVAMGKRSERSEAYLIGQKLLKTACLLVGIQLLVLLAVALLGNGLPFWAVMLIEIILILVSILVLIRKDMARDTVRKIEKDISTSTADVKSLRVKAEALCSTIDDPENAKALQQLADELRYTDPVSNDATAPYESRLDTLLDSIAHHEDPEERGELIRRATALVKERALVAKSSK